MARRTSRSDSRPAKASASRGKRPPRRRARSQRMTVLLRWCVVAAAGFVGFLYYQPLSSYLETRASLNERAAEVQLLAARSAPASRAARAGRDRERAVPRGAPDQPRPARRAALHRQGRRGVASRAGAALPAVGAMDDRALVARQLGRPPRAFLRVAARCPFGAPAVTEQAPYDDAGEPFPTTYYLTCPQLVAAIARLEAAGGVERWSARSTRDAGLRADLDRATEEQRRLRRELAGGRAGRDGGSSLELGIAGSANPGRLKCLHAHAAFALASPGYALGERVLAEVDPLWPPQRCCTSDRRRDPTDAEPSRALAGSGRRAIAGCSRRATTATTTERLLAQVDVVAAELRRRVGGVFTLARARRGIRPRRGVEPRGRRGGGSVAGLAADALARRGGRVPSLRPRRAVDYAP